MIIFTKKNLFLVLVPILCMSTNNTQAMNALGATVVAKVDPKPADPKPNTKAQSNYEIAELVTAILRLVALEIDQQFNMRCSADSKLTLISGISVDVLRIVNDILATKTNLDLSNSCRGLSFASCSTVGFDTFDAVNKIYKLLKKMKRHEVETESAAYDTDINPFCDTNTCTNCDDTQKNVKKIVKYLNAIAPSIEGILAVTRASVKFTKSYKPVYLSTMLLAVVRALNEYPSKDDYFHETSLAIAGITLCSLIADAYFGASAQN